MSTNWTQEAGLTGQIDTDNLQDIVDQAEAHATDSENSATASANSATSSASSASGASTSATNAANSASSASTSATSASTSATNASNSATSASTSATNAANSATAAASSATEAETSATNAASSESSVEANATAAAVSESNASTSETNAANSATSAASSATSAASSATESANSATASAGSATSASASETAAATSETNAANSATAAANSATSASSSASVASTSATSAATSASNANTSETNAATSETNAATSETNAANSASAASTSETNASASAGSASTSASNASTSEANAATSASQAATSASNASSSETNAATSATTATTKASEASTSANNAATSESNAAGSASAAASSASSASASADAALAALDSFDDRYLGQKASDPTLDNDGNALITGALYFNTTDDVMKVYEGSIWVAAYASLSGALLQANNLSDLQSATAARTNLGLGSAATTASTAYATAAQGALADTALQSFTETDPVFTAWDRSAGISITESQISDFGSYQPAGSYEPAFTKNTAFNKNFGTVAGTVAQGSDSRINNGQTAYGWGDHGAEGYLTGNQAITLTGDVSGSGTTSIAVTIADDSHNHTIANVDGLQTALNGKVDDSQVLTNVPAGAVFTDTTYSVGNGGLTEINFTSALNTKLSGIEAGATADQTASEIKTAYESNANTNAFTDTLLAKLNGIESGATGDQSAAEILTAIKTVDGAGSGLDADLLDGQSSAYYQPASTAITTSNIGSQSVNYASSAGNADTLDGNHASAFASASHTHSYLPLSGGDMTGLLAGRTTVGSDVNTNNDTGSFSIRGNSSNAASVSFHRSGAYAVNMGLGTDNVFRIGGWSAAANRLQMDMSGNLTMAGDVTAYSDERLKSDIHTIPNALEKLTSLRGVNYIKDGKESTGVIAQEVEKVLPEVVHTAEDEMQTKSVAYGNMVGLLIEAVKELKAEVDQLKEQING